MKAIVADAARSARDLQTLWGWYLALGIFLVLAGVYVIYAGTAGTVASVIMLAAMLFVAGLAQIVSAFLTRNAGHVILLLLLGVFDVIVAAMIAQHPDGAALTITLLIAALLVFGGIFRFITALWLQFPQYKWMAFSGIVSLALGIVLWSLWPNSASWFLGFAVGVSFIAAGVAWCAFAVNLKNV
jgi:uncharacterized membrane protein HdeD (DUF308 family)